MINQHHQLELIVQGSSVCAVVFYPLANYYDYTHKLLDRPLLILFIMAVIDNLKNAVAGSTGPAFDKNNITVIFVLGGPGVGQ